MTYTDNWERLDGTEQGFKESIFESVGLGRDETEPLGEEMDVEEEFSPQFDSDIEIDAEEGEGDDDDDDEVEVEFIPDYNADVPFSSGDLRPIRRGTDRAKIKPCDGIRDIVFSGNVRLFHSQFILTGSNCYVYRRIDVTLSHGTISLSMVVFDLGTGLSVFYDVPYVPSSFPPHTYTY
jgi:hypothetical protein